MKDVGTVILVALGLAGFAYIFFVFLYPALKGQPLGGGGAGGVVLSTPQSTTNNILASQGMAPIQAAPGNTANLAITDASGLISQYLN